MPLFILLVLALATPLLILVLMPLGLVQRYRAGTARRPARRWMARLNIAALSFSSLLFFGGAALTALWVPRALIYSLAGFGAGCLLGLLGLSLTRWDAGSAGLYYTPNRWLVLALTLLVTARLAYGLWRLWAAWTAGGGERSWLLESGLPGSLGAGAVVLGYYLAWWAGLSGRMSQKRV